MSKAVVLTSGGLDSTACLAMAVNKLDNKNIAALSISYGQRHAKELEAAAQIAKFYDVPHYQLDAASFFQFSKSSLLNTTDALPNGTYAEQIHHKQPISTYVPFRNGLFLSVAAAFAMSIFSDDDIQLFIGVHSDDLAGNAYPDCSASFVASMSAAIRIGTYEKIHIVAPFLCQTKADVVKVGLELEAPFHLTWSCYEHADFPCGKCATCIDRAKAFAVNGVADPALTFLKRNKFLSLV